MTTNEVLCNLENKAFHGSDVLSPSLPRNYLRKRAKKYRDHYVNRVTDKVNGLPNIKPLEYDLRPFSIGCHNNHLQHNKDHDNNRCSKCNAPIIFDSNIIGKERDNVVSLDLNGKRHICSSVERICHETNVVDDIQNRINDANKMELASFQLRLVMEDDSLNVH